MSCSRIDRRAAIAGSLHQANSAADCQTANQVGQQHDAARQYPDNGERPIAVKPQSPPGFMRGSTPMELLAERMVFMIRPTRAAAKRLSNSERSFMAAKKNARSGIHEDQRGSAKVASGVESFRQLLHYFLRGWAETTLTCNVIIISRRTVNPLSMAPEPLPSTAFDRRQIGSRSRRSGRTDKISIPRLQRPRVALRPGCLRARDQRSANRWPHISWCQVADNARSI